MNKQHKTNGEKCWCNPRKQSFKKYTIEEFSKSLYWIVDGYWFKIFSKINGEVVKKFPVEHISVDIDKAEEIEQGNLIKQGIKEI